MNHPSKLGPGSPVTRNWRTTNGTIDVGRDLERRIWDLEIKHRRAMDTPGDDARFALVPALLVPGYTPAKDGSDGRKYYIGYGLVNGVRVKGTLAADGSISDDSDEDGASVLIEVPEDATNFVIYIKGQSFLSGWFNGLQTREDLEGVGFPAWILDAMEAGLHAPFMNFVDDDNELSAPEIGFGDQGTDGGDDPHWTNYPCPQSAIPGDLMPHDGGYNWSCGGWTNNPHEGYRIVAWTRQQPRFPLHRIKGDGSGKFETPMSNLLSDYIMALETYAYATGGEAADGTHPCWTQCLPRLTPTILMEEQPPKQEVCTVLGPGGCFTNVDTPSGRGGDSGNPDTSDALDRFFGRWLYRVYPVDTHTVAMQDGVLWTGDGYPNVVSWGGEELTGSETEEAPFSIALKVEFSGLTGDTGSMTFTPSIVGSVGQDMTPVLTTHSKQPSGWPDGYDITELDAGTLYLPIADVWFDEHGKMVIKENHRGQVSFVLALKGGDDGGTGSTGKEIPLHQASLVCGRVQKEITPLLDDAAFTTEEVVGDIQVTLDASASPVLHWKIQKETKKTYLHRGMVAYADLDDSWTNLTPIDGWQCPS